MNLYRVFAGQTAEFEIGDIFNGNLGTVAAPEPFTALMTMAALLACFLLYSTRLSGIPEKR